MCDKDVDLGIIIDGSASLADSQGTGDWLILLEFIAVVVERLPESGTNVGAIVYSDTAQLVFGLNQYNDLESIVDAIWNLEFSTAQRNTSGALWLARTQLFNGSPGDRPDVTDVILLLTDGKSNVDADKTIPIANDLRQDGINVISIGITEEADVNEVRAVSSLPQIQNLNYFLSEDALQLEEIYGVVQSSICAEGPPPTPDPTPAPTPAPTQAPTPSASPTPSTGMY